MARKGLHLLAETKVRKARPHTKAYRLFDGGGLAYWVPRSGVTTWQFRYRLGGKPQTATLGRGADMTLAEARVEAQRARALVAKGRHVTTEQRVAKAQRIAATTGTFASVAAQWTARQARRKRWTPDYRDEVEASLRNHLATLNALPLVDISAAIVAPIVEHIERKAPDMARKVEQRLQAIMDYGIRRGLIAANPLPRSDPERAVSRKHMPAVLDREGIGAILRDAERLEISRGVRRAHMLTVFTAQRIGEIVPAEWSEIDLETATLTIPRARMKRKDAERGPHLVPLPPGLLALMKEWRRSDGENAVYVCPAPNRDGSVTREAVEKLYRRGLGLSGKHSPHSWRAVFSTWCREAGKAADVVEEQLDHVRGTKVESAYDRGKRLELRRGLMSWYEKALIAARDGGQVVPLRVA